MSLTAKQVEALQAILYGKWWDVNKRTMTSLKRRGFTNGYDLTAKGCDALDLPKPALDPKREELRALQDDIIDLATKQGFPEHMRVSVNMPDDVTVRSLRIMIYPEHIDTLKGVLFNLKERQRAR